ncbi:MAG TPA: AEC family transporter, partial [bacterium]|nr:AEC family transporter [bacterium]
FLLLSSLGMVTAALASGKAIEWKSTLKKVFLFPSTIAFVVALATASWAYPPWLASSIEKVAATLIPMALISVGLQLHFDRKALRREARSLSVGLFFKLILGPALMALVFVACLGMRGLDVKVTVVEAAMAPMITSAIIASENGLNPELSSLMIGLGIPISFLTVPLWYWLLERIA